MIEKRGGYSVMAVGAHLRAWCVVTLCKYFLGNQNDHETSNEGNHVTTTKFRVRTNKRWGPS